jgi:hypothetical protein
VSGTDHDTVAATTARAREDASQDTRAPAPGDASGGGVKGTGAAGPQEPTPVSPAVYKRLTSGLGGYSIAMLACLVLVGLVVLITPRDQKEVLPTVGYTFDMKTLGTSAPYTAYGPEGLPAGWRPTSSRLTGVRGSGPTAWHLGFVTPRDEYAALEESDEGAEAFVKRMTNRDRPEGVRQVAGASWDQYFRADKNQRSLARRLHGVTLVITGTASYDELGVLAAALRPLKTG